MKMINNKNNFKYKKQKLEAVFGESISDKLAIQLLDFVQKCPDFLHYYVQYFTGGSIAEAIEQYLEYIRNDKQIFYRKLYQENQFNFQFILFYLLLGMTVKKSLKKTEEFYNFVNTDPFIDRTESFIARYKDSEVFRNIVKKDGFVPPKLVKRKPNNK
jgi:hypothetical protein